MSNKNSEKRSFLNNNQERVLFSVLIVVSFLLGMQLEDKRSVVKEKKDISVTRAEDKIPGRRKLSQQELLLIAEEAAKRKSLKIPIEVKQSFLRQGESSSKNNSSMADCPLIASKNSTKYHFKECKSAHRIKDKNRLCFETKQQAENEGYVLANDCSKK